MKHHSVLEQESHWFASYSPLSFNTMFDGGLVDFVYNEVDTVMSYSFDPWLQESLIGLGCTHGGKKSVNNKRKR